MGHNIREIAKHQPNLLVINNWFVLWLLRIHTFCDRLYLLIMTWELHNSSNYYNRPSVYNCIALFTTNNINTLTTIGLVLVKAFERRNAVVNNQNYLKKIKMFLVSLYLKCLFFLCVLPCTCKFFSVDPFLLYLYSCFVSMRLCCIRPTKSYVGVGILLGSK